MNFKTPRSPRSPSLEQPRRKLTMPASFRHEIGMMELEFRFFAPSIPFKLVRCVRCEGSLPRFLSGRPAELPHDGLDYGVS
jgi:hypothetical protein